MDCDLKDIWRFRSSENIPTVLVLHVSVNKRGIASSDLFNGQLLRLRLFPVKARIPFFFKNLFWIRLDGLGILSCTIGDTVLCQWWARCALLLEASGVSFTPACVAGLGFPWFVRSCRLRPQACSGPHLILKLRISWQEIGEMSHTKLERSCACPFQPLAGSYTFGQHCTCYIKPFLQIWQQKAAQTWRVRHL